MEVFGTAVQFQRIWLCHVRKNGTCRPNWSLSALENKKPVSGNCDHFVYGRILGHLHFDWLLT